jgi:hypothetical protein
MYTDEYVNNLIATYEATAVRHRGEIEYLRQVIGQLQEAGSARLKEIDGYRAQEGKITDLMIRNAELVKSRDAAREAATEARENLANALERATSAEAARAQMAELANGRASLVTKQTATLGLQNQEIARLLAEKQRARKLLRATRRFIKATL